MHKSYPLTIIADRYTGVYSGGRFTAFNCYPLQVPAGAQADDVTCAEYWSSSPLAGVGDTPDEAVEDLLKRLQEVHNVDF